MHKLMALLVIVWLPGLALAQEKSLTASGEAELLSGSLGDTAFTRGDIGVGLRYEFVPRLGIEAGFRAGWLRLRFEQQPTAGLAANGTLLATVQPSARAALTFAPLLDAHHRLDLAAEFESSLPGSDPRMSDLRVSTPDGDFDVSRFGSERIEAAVFWKRASLGLRYQLTLGRFEPTLGVAFETVALAVDLRLTDDGNATLRSLGFDEERIARRYSEDRMMWLVPLRLGLAYRVGRSGHVYVGGLMAPGAGPLFGGNLGYSHSW